MQHQLIRILIHVQLEQHHNHPLNHHRRIHYDHQFKKKKMMNINEVFHQCPSKYFLRKKKTKFFLHSMKIKSFRFVTDDDSCPMPCSSSSSSSLSDGELINNNLETIQTTTTTTTTTTTSIATATTGQFLWIDHHPRRHSIANDSHLIESNHFHYHPSSPFVDHSTAIGDVRDHFASAYILTTGSVRISSIHFFFYSKNLFSSL